MGHPNPSMGASPGRALGSLTKPEAETAWTAFQATAAPKKPQSHLKEESVGGGAA